MRLPLLPFFIFWLICLAIDVYIYFAARRRCASKVPSKIQFWSTVAIYVFLGVTVCLPRRSGSDAQLAMVMWSLFTVMSIYFSKILFVVVDLLASIPCLFGHKRLSFLSLTGGVLAILTFLGMWWGALVNRFRIKVNEEEIEIAELPPAFDGYRIVQISDLHAGTYGRDTTFVSHLVDKVNSLDGDVIVFTGDIVNRKSSELQPHMVALSRLDAPDGVISILGNHDYGDYCDWPTAAAKEANRKELIDMQANMGWRLLLNETEKIRRHGDSIAVVGVENVGDPPFTVYGSLKDAYPDLHDSVTKILLTHNPAHWVQEIADKSNKIDLTLSGHTHAMQIELFGLSPAAFRYKTWGGLYRDNKGLHPLYVNIGIGTVGLPMRFGATPEISVLTLKRAN